MRGAKQAKDSILAKWVFKKFVLGNWVFDKIEERIPNYTAREIDIVCMRDIRVCDCDVLVSETGGRGAKRPTRIFFWPRKERKKERKEKRMKQRNLNDTFIYGLRASENDMVMYLLG